MQWQSGAVAQAAPGWELTVTPATQAAARSAGQATEQAPQTPTVGVEQ